MSLLPPRRRSKPSRWMTPERLAQGYVIVLPGIEGKSFLNRSIVRGLLRADVPYGIEIHDWTYGVLGYFLNLRYRRRHRQQSEILVEKIAAYREHHPTQPVYLIGHSGGGAMTAFTLERLPVSMRVTGGVMLVPALSSTYDLSPALEQTERGLWNFSSWGDACMLGLGTILLGTCDGKHRPAAGMTGFSEAVRHSCDSNGPDDPQLHEVPFRREMVRDRNCGGHFGPVNSRFVQHWIAPIVLGGNVPSPHCVARAVTASARGPSRIVESPGEAPQPVR